MYVQFTSCVYGVITTDYKKSVLAYVSILYGLFMSHLLTNHSQPAFTCSKLTIETLEQGVKYVQS